MKLGSTGQACSTLSSAISVKRRLKTALLDTDNAESRTYVYTRGLPSEFCARANSLPGLKEKAEPIFGTFWIRRWIGKKRWRDSRRREPCSETSLSEYGKRIEESNLHKECDHEEQLLEQLPDA
ncbi:hypothetical protein LAZ67_18000915 [Cordylochernes scorpioides]|uniref:Uncharacterized protein n=1 Tax=Cordylochernes scorpioides TaxID=51811 RepID=A0ABY6LGP2_9ARAC|nr:hypothetical protein LAZ67_18000915 [Cordylochernes scorpioides]